MNTGKIPIFLDGATAPTTSESYNNSGYESLNIVVDGTFTGASMVVQGKLANGEFHNLMCANLANASTASAITATGIYAIVGVDACDEIRVVLNSIASGSIRAVGRFTY